MANSLTPDEAKVLERVRKMLRLAADAAATDGERDNALRMAHATLAKHNLSLAQAEAESGANAAERVARGRESCSSRNQPWAKHLAHAVARTCFCAYFSSPCAAKGKVEHNFVGRAGNASTAQSLTAYLLASITSQANREWKKQPNPGPWWTAFCKGASDRVAERCKALTEEAEREEQCRALVLANFAKVEASANALFIREGLGLALRMRKNRERASPRQGYIDGQKFGDGLSLNRQVGAAAPTGRLA